MKNAPWNTDHGEVLLQKWRLTHETVTNLERLKARIETFKTRIDYVLEGTSEYKELAVSTKKAFYAANEELFKSGLTKSDWDWFVHNKISDEPEHWKELGEESFQSQSLHEILDRVDALLGAVSMAKQKFADAIKLSLNAWEEADDKKASWYQKVEAGVRIHGKLVEVGGRDADVMEFLCKRTSQLSSYRDIAELHTTWSKGLDSGNNGAIKSSESSIRTSLGKIRAALRSTFTLPDGTDPLIKGKTSQGWKLDKDLLQTNSQ